MSHYDNAVYYSEHKHDDCCITACDCCGEVICKDTEMYTHIDSTTLCAECMKKEL